MYQQRPAPAKGAIFDAGWWRYWTVNAEKVTPDGRVVYLDPDTLTGARWVDSWDCSFKSGVHDAGGWVVGQRWVRERGNRYLIAQQRGRWTFTQTISAMNSWAQTDNPIASPCGHLVHERLIEDRANGTAIIDVLKEKISGIKPINPTSSKESRARAVTPEIESGNVFLPHPSDPGNEWVTDLLSELRNFPHDMADDQVDALTQGLSALRSVTAGKATVPGRMQRGKPQWQVPRDVARTALNDLGRRRY
jgi:predicted phage terminase large subunit-like protein